MGFWDKAFQVAKDVGTTAANSLNEKANEIRQLKEKYESMSDEELRMVCKTSACSPECETVTA